MIDARFILIFEGLPGNSASPCTSDDAIAKDKQISDITIVIGEYLFGVLY